MKDLKVVLDALEFQSYKNFEIVVSEDGEYDGMRSFLEGYTHSNRILHLTQPDVGWRKNQALNNALRRCEGDYIIFIDGDCVLHHKFIENHIRYSSPTRIVAGKRIKLGPRWSDMFREKSRSLHELEKAVVANASDVRKDGARFFEEGIYINPDGLFGFIPKLRSMKQLKGCNMSCYREAIEKINGFDEDYILPAIGEDIDLTWRFKGLGYKLFSVRNLAVQYHLHHKENWSDQSVNENLMKAKMEKNQFVCVNGLNKIV